MIDLTMLPYKFFPEIKSNDFLKIFDYFIPNISTYQFYIDNYNNLNKIEIFYFDRGKNKFNLHTNAWVQQKAIINNGSNIFIKNNFLINYNNQNYSNNIIFDDDKFDKIIILRGDNFSSFRCINEEMIGRYPIYNINKLVRM